MNHTTKYVIKELTEEGRLIDPLVGCERYSNTSPFKYSEFNTHQEAIDGIGAEVDSENTRYIFDGLRHRILVILPIYTFDGNETTNKR